MKHNDAPSLSKGPLFLMASAVSATAANLYYNQPILPSIGKDLGISQDQLGWIPAASQIGYASALLFISPLGDSQPRKRLISLLSLVLVMACLLASWANGLTMLILACFMIGLGANITQQLIPFAASLSSPESKGSIIATLMTGLTVGILLSRVVSGFVSELYGWRSVFIMSAFISSVFGLLLYRYLPSQQAVGSMPYKALVLSMLGLLKRYKVLRQSALAGAFWFASFNALWATLALHLAQAPFHFSAHQTGLLGVVALAGVAGAKLAGRYVNQVGVSSMINISLLVIAAGFAITGFFSQLLWAILLGIVLIDLGVFGAQVSNQVRVFSIDPKAQSRINGVYMLGYYLGGATGSFAGVLAFEQFAWLGVVGISLIFLLLSLLVNRVGCMR
ncbi:MFS transporter [Marinomonas epiphytica]